MISRPEGRVLFHCDTRGCFAECETREGRLPVAGSIARAKGWGISGAAARCPRCAK